MTYIRVTWKHDHRDFPVTLYSELDDQRWEIRKVEVFRDGRMGYASANEAAGGTMLGLVPVPYLSEIARDPEFEPVAITSGEFEEIWSMRSGR